MRVFRSRQSEDCCWHSASLRRGGRLAVADSEASGPRNCGQFASPPARASVKAMCERMIVSMEVRIVLSRQFAEIVNKAASPVSRRSAAYGRMAKLNLVEFQRH